MSELLLGRTTPSPETYTPSVLHPIPRKRSPLVPYGHDFWRCYELSWLNPSGKPEVAICEVVYPV
ncbi:MAG: NADPH-dependent 7-cyano-7-deazaguanine reductase QueF, partial [Desulfomonilia bacterium]|nr:NADPH-dependent 7-cyano-7-deazaguanine reductase QueF [Desulfomonilia bacterium]